MLILRIKMIKTCFSTIEAFSFSHDDVCYISDSFRKDGRGFRVFEVFKQLEVEVGMSAVPSKDANSDRDN